MSLEQWEIYYRGGAIATGPAGPDGLYDQELNAAWQDFFDALPEQARLLDIGTGNGVLPLMALQAAQERGANWSVDATDLAQIDPVKFVPRGERRFESVRFHPGVPNERLPFAPDSFDGVSGHYALEYGDTTASLRETARVLKPGCQAQFVLHHAQSVLISSAQRSLAQCNLVFKQTRIFRKLHRLVSAENPSQDFLKRTQADLSSSIRQLKQALETLRSLHPEEGRILAIALDATRALLAARRHGRPSVVALEVDRAEEELRTAGRRLCDLSNHAVDAEAFAHIVAAATAAGFEAHLAEPIFHARDNLVGWLLRLQKR